MKTSPLHLDFINFMYYSAKKFNQRYPKFKKDKLIAYQMVKDTVNHPHIYLTLKNIKSLNTSILNTIPHHNFVIKSTKGHQANKVFCINRNPLGLYRDLMRSPLWISDTDMINLIRNTIGIQWPHRLIIEEFIGNGTSIPFDYKVYVVKGKAKIITVYSRGQIQGNFRNIYNHKWNRIPLSKFYINSKYPDGPPDFNQLPPLETREKITKIAEKLSRKFKTLICRFDFFCVENKIYFGEITPICGGLAYHPVTKLALKILFPPEVRKSWHQIRLRGF